jgi:hypothetical protein
LSKDSNNVEEIVNKKTPTFLLKSLVGDIDLTSNQMLDFLEYFIEEMS